MITLPVLCCRAAAAGPGADQHCSAWLCLWGHIPTTSMPVGLLLNTIIQRKLWLRNKSHCSTEAVRGSSNRGKGSTLRLVISFVVQGYAYLSEAFSPCPLLLPALLSPASNPSRWCKADLSRETSHKASSLEPHGLFKAMLADGISPHTKEDPTLQHHPSPPHPHETGKKVSHSLQAGHSARGQSCLCWDRVAEVPACPPTAGLALSENKERAQIKI